MHGLQVDNDHGSRNARQKKKTDAMNSAREQIVAEFTSTGNCGAHWQRIGGNEIFLSVSERAEEDARRGWLFKFLESYHTERAKRIGLDVPPDFDQDTLEFLFEELYYDEGYST